MQSTTATTANATTAAARASSPSASSRRNKRKLLIIVGQALTLLFIQMGMWRRMSGGWSNTAALLGTTQGETSSWLLLLSSSNYSNNTIHAASTSSSAGLAGDVVEFWSVLSSKSADDDELSKVLAAATSVELSPSSSASPLQQQLQQQQQQPQSTSPPPAATAGVSNSSNEKSDDSDDSRSNKNYINCNNKPYFILHIGPPKTGTTTLQGELTAAQRHGWLRLDNFLYTGQYVNQNDKNVGRMSFVKSILSQKCHLQLEKCRLKFQKAQRQHAKTNQSSTAAASLAGVLRQVDCWKDALTTLESYRLNKTNIIHSDETYGYKWRPWEYNNKSRHMGPWDWTSLHETLHDAGWNVVVVVGYRRYAEWILSVKQHVEKWTGHKPRHAQWPTISSSTQNNNNNNGGIVFAPPFPTVLTVQSGQGDHWLKSYYPFYDVNFILESLQNVVVANNVPMDVRILNLHEATTAEQTTSSVRTTFLCHVLNHTAPNACLKSLAMDRRQQLVAVTQQATTTHSSRRRRRPRVVRANIAQNAQSVMYDVLATTAAARGMVNISRHGRRQVFEYCQELHENTLQHEVLPYLCPTQEQLQALLDLSLQKEADAFQKLATSTTTRHQHPLPLLPPPPLATTKQHHVDSFWRAASLPNHTNKYCWIDAPAVLQRKEWQDLFATLQR